MGVILLIKKCIITNWRNFKKLAKLINDSDFRLITLPFSDVKNYKIDFSNNWAQKNLSL